MGELAIQDLLAAYFDMLIPLVDLDHVHGAVEALVARDSAARWWEGSE